MYNYSKLKGRITELYDTQLKFAEKIKNDPASVSMKLSGKAEFKQSDIAAWCKALKIKFDEIPVYFFTK